MAAWRTRFIYSVSESIISEALLVAESIAVMRAACSAATDSVMAWKSMEKTYCGSSPANNVRNYALEGAGKGAILVGRPPAGNVMPLSHRSE